MGLVTTSDWKWGKRKMQGQAREDNSKKNTDIISYSISLGEEEE